MASNKPRESELKSGRDKISENASDWMQQFVKHFEINFLDNIRSLLPDAPSPDYQRAAARAVFQTFLESGMDTESVAENLGNALVERSPGPIEWTSESNRWRFELIDREIQETLTPAEKIELAGLTKRMREELESEANLPLEGAKALHQKLLGLNVGDKPR